MPPTRTFLDFIVTSIHTASRPFISISLRRLHERVSRAYITTPPPGRSRLSVLKGGKKFRSAISSSVMLGLSQLSLKKAMSYNTDSVLIKSILGNKLWTLR